MWEIVPLVALVVFFSLVYVTVNNTASNSNSTKREVSNQSRHVIETELRKHPDSNPAANQIESQPQITSNSEKSGDLDDLFAQLDQSFRTTGVIYLFFQHTSKDLYRVSFLSCTSTQQINFLKSSVGKRTSGSSLKNIRTAKARVKIPLFVKIVSFLAEGHQTQRKK